MAGEQAGGWTGKLNRKISREEHAVCVLHLQLSGSVMEIWRKLFGAHLFFSSTCAKCWKISTCWMTAKKIMESERAFFFFFMFYECTCLDDLHLSAGNYIKHDRDCTLPMDSAEVPFLHCAWSGPLPAGNTLIEAFFLFFFRPLEVQEILSGSFYLTDCLFLFQYMNSARSLK